jgi:hypothetical protein
MEFTLKCKLDSNERDRIEVSRDYDGDIRFYAPANNTVFTDDSGAREFARKILALVGDEAPEAEPLKVGDLVEVTVDRHHDTSDVGKRGRLTRIDTDDVPYGVTLDNGAFIWVTDVRKVPPTVSSTRSTLLAEARREAGTGASPADVLAYAKFLSE